MKGIKRIIGIGLVLALTTTLLAGCGAGAEDNKEGNQADSGNATVRLQLKWLPQTQWMGYYVAQEKGYYAEEGIDIEILPGGPDIVPEQQVANGAADIGIGWVGGSLLPHQDQGFPLVEIAQIAQKSGLYLVSEKEKGIESPEDLAGKKIGVWFGGWEYEILALLNKYGIDSDQGVELTKQGYTMDQLYQGQIDVATAMSYNEYMSILESGISEDDLNVIDMNDEGVAMLEDCLFANQDWLKENKESAVRFLRATLKGWQYAVEHPEEATDIVMKYVDTTSTTREHQLKQAQEISKLVKPEDLNLSDIGYMDEEKLQQTADIAYQFGVVKNKPDLSKLYTTEIWELATQEK
ncbi:ABC transporter substrate-binding protein [Aminipila butyrica]|uniref:Thiamine pyrimidine synthase n=1 Tax=Aminipila butyrica TaxID=433296 RepID=A0A858C111_9FIRM|nr:ABC transporter substrate-binding protein [Aminipila butyrica]QIB70106.1 ABC transporter substrate-binding protein [Aminipila butyrica]